MKKINEELLTKEEKEHVEKQIKDFSKAKEQCITKQCFIETIIDEEEFYKNIDLNCIPNNIFSMTANDYEIFLQYRRKKMAEKIKNYYYSI